ncbi:hypothetical protein ACSTJ7_09940 [Vibrio parahaemolyticus]|uniref:hypothetical protein n=1 Tax=Vibrio TaxID=662 RepID=UPI001244E975|nr:MULTISPECIES: hypothetical protein [Vibrio]HCG7383676.1 hypothetical protein [Vibrio parahaemolyticus]KAB0317216.1 hypothetical protein F6W79_19710 [Vibrio diabolicus]MBL4287457.1 hypothetical protein [Vibrio fluvialis]MBL4291109.1 hypothetical protein [Vibrio fluvialis]WMN57879.1 hypothetical protein NI390_16445 [Vibrio fluvialis]
MTQNSDEVVSKSTFRASIAASIVASIIFISLIQPVMTYVWNTISSTGNEYLNYYVDLMYANAALGERNWVVVTVAILGIYLPFVLLLGKGLGQFTTRKLDQSIQNSDNEVAKKKKVSGLLFKLNILRWLLAAIGLGLATIMASYIYTDLQLNASFNQRLAVLAPKLSKVEYLQYRADWASMTSKQDYKLLEARLNNQAHELEVHLPSPLLKD